MRNHSTHFPILAFPSIPLVQDDISDGFAAYEWSLGLACVPALLNG